MTTERLNYKHILCLGGAFVGFTTGAGFSSGQELLQFFTSYGYMGIVAVIVSMLIFIWYGYCLMEHGRLLQHKNSSEIFKYFCGKHLGIFFDWFTIGLLFCIATIMVSGAGSTLHQYYGLPNIIGRLIIATLILVSVLSGLDKLVQIIGKVGPFIATIAIFVGLFSFIKNFNNFGSVNNIMTTVSFPKAACTWYISSLLYPAYTLIAITPFLSSVGKSACSKKTTVLAAVFGGTTLLIAAMMLNLGMLCNLNAIEGKAIPVLILAKDLSPILGVSFSIVLVLGMFSTSVPMVWSITSKFATDGTKKYKITACLVVLMLFAGGSLPFSELIGAVYPITGYVGIILLGGMIYRTYIKKDIKNYRCKINS